MTKVYLLFYNSVIPLFTSFNKFLQREDPCIFAIYPQMISFMKKLFGKFVTIEAIREGLPVLRDVDFMSRENQLPDGNLFIGAATRETSESLEEDGLIPPRAREVFFKAVRSFYETAASEANKKLPWDDKQDILKRSLFINFSEKESATFEDVIFFIKKYHQLLPYSEPHQTDKIQEEFTEYQPLVSTDIPDEVWHQALLQEDGDGRVHRMDIIWGYLASCKLIGGTRKFGKLAEVAKIVLSIPHSNAGEERVFTMVRKNKTDFRGSLSLDGTLSSLLTIKMANPESVLSCYKWEPSKELLTKAKGATMEYNRLHKKQIK